MSKADTAHTSLFPGKILRLFFVWPFKLLWKIVTTTCNAIGILLSLLLGSALMFAGYILVTTFIGAIIGLPMMVIGAFLILRALY
ncbi:MAG: hypothetical protein VCD00_01220 [Candidatus Hydrogenedentota bacterium]